MSHNKHQFYSVKITLNMFIAYRFLAKALNQLITEFQLNENNLKFIDADQVYQFSSQHRRRKTVF